MVETGKNTHHEIKQKQCAKRPGMADQDKGQRNSPETEKKHVFVFVPVGIVRDDELKYHGHEQSQVRKDADMGILGNNIVLAVKKGKNHRDRNGGCVVKSMEDRSG